MTAIRSLRLRLGSRNVGSLFSTDDGRVYFRFDDDYALDRERPILSLSFLGEDKAETRAFLVDPSLPLTLGTGGGKLPVFFRNLLPEGPLRKQLIAEAGLVPDDELGLLAYCGRGLPGDVYAEREELDDVRLGRLLTQGRDSYEMSAYQFPTPEATSLSGVQPKVALVAAPGGRYVMRSKEQSGRHFIGKLPASDYERLPEVEFLSLQLAQAAGVEVCDAELLPLTAIADTLPFALRDDARNFLLVARFDRDNPTPTGRVHMEDMAQVFSIQPEDKYTGTYVEMGQVLQGVSSRGDDIFELLRRIKVNEMLGNADAHLKNFSILYAEDGIRLAPAYDIVAYAAYLKNQGNALRFFPDQPKGRSVLSPAVVRRLADEWGVPEKRLLAALKECVAKAVQAWPEMIASSALSGQQKRTLMEHFESDAAVLSLMKRRRTA